MHNSNKFKKFYYAVPSYLEHSEYLPINCGLITVDKNLKCKIVRPAKINSKSKALTQDEILKLASLGCMRIWNLKKHLQAEKLKVKKLKNVE